MNSTPTPMRKILFALGTVALALLATPAAAQYYYLPGSVNGNPGGINTDSEYPVGGGLATSWTTISAAPAASPAWSTVQTLPFAFNFNGSPVTQYKVSTSGVLTFDANAATAPSYTKPLSYTLLKARSYPSSSGSYAPRSMR